MSTLNTFKTVSMALVAAAVCVSLQAHATAVNTSLNFIDPGGAGVGPFAVQLFRQWGLRSAL